MVGERIPLPDDSLMHTHLFSNYMICNANSFRTAVEHTDVGELTTAVFFVIFKISSF